jgi:hypothetical protein
MRSADPFGDEFLALPDSVWRAERARKPVEVR